MTYWGFLPGVLELCWLNRVSHCTCYHPSHCKYGVYVCGACMCVCTHTHTHTDTHMQKSHQCVMCPRSLSALLPWGRVSHWTGSLSFHLGWLACEHLGPTFSHTQTLGLHTGPAMPSLFVSSGALDSGPHTCMANALRPWTLSPAFLSILQALFFPFLLNSR